MQNHAIGLLTTTKKETASAYEIQTIVRDYAVFKGLEIIGFLAIDPKNLDTGIKQAILMAHAKRAHHLIVDRESTFAVLPAELVSIIELLLQYSITLTFACTKSHFDSAALATLKNLIFLTKLAEKKKHSLRIKSSLWRKKKEGKRLGGRKFGLTANEAMIIDQILSLYAEGKSLQKICEILSVIDVKTVQNKKWHPTTIKRIIDRSKKGGRGNT